jgi:hypothetical protein
MKNDKSFFTKGGYYKTNVVVDFFLENEPIPEIGKQVELVRNNNGFEFLVVDLLSVMVNNLYSNKQHTETYVKIIIVNKINEQINNAKRIIILLILPNLYRSAAITVGM